MFWIVLMLASGGFVEEGVWEQFLTISQSFNSRENAQKDSRAMYIEMLYG